MEQTVFSETLASKLQMPVNHPEESIQHSEHGESLKLRINELNKSVIRLVQRGISCTYGIHETLLITCFQKYLFCC
jgi:hypothetical protein